MAGRVQFRRNLAITEKELHNLNYPFKTIPSMKIAKLAVDSSFLEKYKGIGSFMIEFAMSKALSCNEDWTCSITRLVISQVLRFFRLKPYKTAFFNGSCSKTEVFKQLYS
jgi:hypothetical protein